MSTSTPDTIVLVHGFWVTPRSWEHWTAHYESLGYRVVVPAYPGFEVEVEALNRDPSPVVRLTTPAVIDHLVSVVGKLPAPPILVGHSAGGAFVQLLLDRGFGAAGVAICSAPTQGVPVVPLSQVRATWPALRNPANRKRAVALTPRQWHYAFTNTFPDDESLRLHARYHVPASGGILFQTALAGRKRTPGPTWVDYARGTRAPLLFVSAAEDHLMPPAVQSANAAKYSGGSVTEVRRYDGMPHLLPAHPEWQRVADDVLDWAVQHAASEGARVPGRGGA